MTGIALITLSPLTLEQEALVRVRGAFSATLGAVGFSGTARATFILLPPALPREIKLLPFPRTLHLRAQDRTFMTVTKDIE